MIHFVVGTKAQMIKVAPVMSILRKREIYYNFIFTGQHQNTMDKIQENFKLDPPDTTLYQGKDITGIFQMLRWILRIMLITIFKKKKIFECEGTDDIVLVHGDTFSTLLGAIMGRLSGKKVGHIESGLRSFKLLHPFPEELTRLIVFKLSHFYFCPGEWAIDNLKKYSGVKVNTQANTLYDCIKTVRINLNEIEAPIPSFSYAIVSIHRFENIFNKEQFNYIVDELIRISSSMKLLFILHPPTLRKLEEFGLLKKLSDIESIELRPRYDYFQFIKLLENSEFLVSDGGSNQEEAFYIGIPTLLFRKASERPEGIGENIILSNFDSKIVTEFISNYRKYKRGELILEVSPSKIIADSVVKYQ